MTQTTGRGRWPTNRAVGIWTLLVALPAVVVVLYTTVMTAGVDPMGLVRFVAVVFLFAAFAVWLVGLFLIAVAQAIGRRRQRRGQSTDEVG